MKVRARDLKGGEGGEGGELDTGLGGRARDIGRGVWEAGGGAD